VEWRDDDGEVYKYPRCMFPINLSILDEFEYAAGEFTPLGEFTALGDEEKD
jgi:hypothetical protein